MEIVEIETKFEAHSIKGLKNILLQKQKTLQIINNICFISENMFAVSSIVDKNVNIWLMVEDDNKKFKKIEVIKELDHPGY